MLLRFVSAGPDGDWESAPAEAAKRTASAEPTVLGVYTSLLMTFTRPSRRPTVNGEVWLDFHEVSGLDVSGVLENCVSIVDDVRSLS